MAALHKVEKFDMEGLEEFKKSLFCVSCYKSPRPPGPGSKIYRCVEFELDLDGFLCQSCFEDDVVIYHHDGSTSSKHKECEFKFDAMVTNFVSLLKFYECVHRGCKKEFEAKDLETHENICRYRLVTCPKLNCNEKIPFCRILEFYQKRYCQCCEHLIIKDNVLDYKGSLEDLGKNVFVLNNYGRPFFPQFYVKGHFLHFWVVGHGDQNEVNSFEVITYLNWC